jgi:hypothetical protein
MSNLYNGQANRSPEGGREKSENLQLFASVPRSIRTQLGIAVMFIIMGFGNVIFANLRYNEYSSLLEKARSELRDHSHERVRDLPVFVPAMNLDEQSKYINKLKARLNFYEFVIMGGKYILSLAGILLLGCLPRLGQSLESSPSKVEPPDRHG